MVQDEIFFDPTGAPLAAHASGALHVQDIMCLRGSHCLFDGFSLTLDPGAALAVYGANGAGKTSLLRLIAGLVPIQAGAVTLQAAPDMAVAVHYVGHLDGLKNALRVWETLQGFAEFYGRAALSEWQTKQILSLIGLSACADRLVDELSAGQRRRLALARLLPVARPLWLLDEPFTALDTQGREVLTRLVGAHLALNGMVIASSHEALPFATQTITLPTPQGRL